MERAHFPTEQAALKCLYLVTRSLDPTGKGRARVGDALEASVKRLSRSPSPAVSSPATDTNHHHDRLHRSSDTPHGEALASRQSGEPAWPWVFTFDAAKATRYRAAALARYWAFLVSPAGWGWVGSSTMTGILRLVLAV